MWMPPHPWALPLAWLTFPCCQGPPLLRLPVSDGKGSQLAGLAEQLTSVVWQLAEDRAQQAAETVPQSWGLRRDPTFSVSSNLPPDLSLLQPSAGAGKGHIFGITRPLTGLCDRKNVLNVTAERGLRYLCMNVFRDVGEDPAVREA